MPYATLADLNIAFGSDTILDLTDRNGDGAADVAFVNAVLADTDGIINGYLASAGYEASGMATVPPQIKAWAVDIAYYRLHSTDTTEHASSRYKEAIRVLERIADGKQKIDLPTHMDKSAIDTAAAQDPAVTAIAGRKDWGQRQ